MDLHAPAGPLRSLKDFLLHIGVVTIGILIALGLEQVVEARHRARIAAEAVAGFQREIADNVAQVQEVVADMRRLRTQSQAEIAALLAPPAHGPAPKINYPGSHFDLVSSASWDTAIATQALIDLPYDSVKRFAEAYGVLHLFQDQERVGLGTWHDMHRFGDNAAALSAEQRSELIEQLRLYESYTHLIEDFGKDTVKVCQRALE